MRTAQASDWISPDEIVFNKYEIPFYKFAELTPQAALQMSFASPEIKDPQPWLAVADGHVAYEIDLVFTKYPKDIHRWNYNYEQLITDRVSELLVLDSAFLEKDIKWNMILQTQCQKLEEAEGYFHGFVIKYRPLHVRVIDVIKSPEDLRDMIRGDAVPKDSTVINVMQRHPEWRDMLVVMDWTGSMYQYGAQMVLWHKMLFRNGVSQKTRHMVFFNDGNKKKKWQKKIGQTGGIYYTQADDIMGVVDMMEKVMVKGNGGDIPENDVEALLKSTSMLTDYKSVILIADNESAVRDLELLTKIKKPVHIILCGVQEDRYINPDYIKIAYHTKGSLHTIEEDIMGLNRLQAGEEIFIGKQGYTVKKGKIVMIPKLSQ